MVRRAGGQAMVEFALLAPVVLVMFIALADVSRGLLAFTEISAGARAGAREAVLEYNADSNTGAPACYPASCNVPGVMPMIQRLAGFGFPVVYADSPSLSSPPGYGTCPGGCSTSTTAPLTNLQLNAATTSANTVYVFVYELDSTPGAQSPRWATSGLPVRTGGNQTVVVDLKMRWSSVTLSLLNITATVPFDAQTVERIEW